MHSTVLVVEDDPSLREALCDTLELGGYRALAAQDGETALGALDGAAVDLVVSDIQMPGLDGHGLLQQLKAARPELPVLLMTAYGTIDSAVRAMRDGAADYLVKPFEPEVLVGRVAQLVGDHGASDEGLVASDPRTLEVLELARRVAASEATVMITGESGSGKEVLFRFIHAHSPRAGGPAVAINCAAIPENMLEAILFGYEKGAFTGAYKACAGKFEQAQGGTLLLDEISEMSLSLQAKLLRVLQERQVERLGGQELVELDVRVIATSNRDLRQEVAQGRFREDLYYRLNVFPLRMPALRERPRDIVPLARYLLGRAAGASRQAVPTLSEDAQARLLRHPWPGNVRELDNVMQRALIIQASGVVNAKDLHFESVAGASIPPAGPPAQADSAPAEGLGEDLKARERRLILEALCEGKGSRQYAARKLGVSPRTLRYKLARMREMGVDVSGSS